MSKAHAYEVKEHSVEDLLSPAGVTFEVPTFQRRFSWGREEVEELLDDLYGNDDWLSKQGEALPYFLGSIVLARGNGADLVLDGQQRLTTVSLLIAVLKHKMQKLGHSEAEGLSNFLEAGKLGQKKKSKIKPQQEDAPTYMALYKNPQESSAPHLRKNRLAGAVRTLMAGVDEYADKLAVSHGFTIVESLENMAGRLIYGVEFVRITAPSEAAAFRLFETLNDRGLELSAADLVKNKLFAQCGPAYLEDVRDLWKEITEAIGESELVSFLRNFLISRGTPVRKNDLYDELKTHIEINLKQPLKIVEFAKDVREAALIYRELMAPSVALGWNSEVVESLKRLNTFRARSGRPALLACAQLNPSAFPDLVRALEIVAVRYSVIGQLKPVVLEKSYAAMCKELRQNPEQIKSAINKLGAAVPDDEKFAATFADLNIDHMNNAWREILIGLNNTVASGETRVNGPDKVHIEHILPRNPSKKALIEADLTTEEADDLSGRIGNLTLLSGKKNQNIGNKEFSHKKPVFEASEIALNASIASESNVIWGRDEIEARSKALAADAVKTWPWVFA